MTPEYVLQHWALLTASIVGSAVALFVVWRAWLDSRRGRLAGALRRLRHRHSEARQQHQSVEKTAATLARLQARSDSVMPRRLQEVAEAVQDAEALLKIAADQVLIAQNHVRAIIVEEFPPKHHEAMRSKYLEDGGRDDRPFSF